MTPRRPRFGRCYFNCQSTAMSLWCWNRAEAPVPSCTPWTRSCAHSSTPMPQGLRRAYSGRGGVGCSEASVGETLVGGLLVIAGGLLTFAGGYWMQTRQWKREDKYRDYADRRQVYLEFLASWHSYEETRTRTPPDQKEFEKAELQFQRSFNALSLIAPEEVHAAA